MCGRYQIKDPQVFREYLRSEYGVELPELRPRFNVAPSQTLPIVTADEGRGARVALMRWGLVPFWDKAEKPKLAPINARAEEAFSKPMFRQSLQKRRALVLADGFYEWQKLGTHKQPVEIQLRGSRPFFFAGIYEAATDIRPETFLLFTTRPNELMQPIHDRMPAIVTGDRARRWLEPGPITETDFAEVTEPFSAAEMEVRPVSTLVNSPRNDSPACVAGPDDQGELKF